MNIKWIALMLFSKFVFIYCADCSADKVQYLAKIEIKWDDELIQHGLGSLIHPDYVLTAGSLIYDYYQFHDIGSKYPSISITFDRSDLKDVFKVKEIIIIPKLYDPLSTDFALIELETRPKIPPAYTRALYQKQEKIVSTTQQYYLGTVDGIIKLKPTDRHIIDKYIDTISQDDGDVYDEEIGAPLFYCDDKRQQFIQVGIFTCFSSANQRHANLILLVEPIFEYIADHTFSKCSMHRRINDGKAIYHNRAQLGDSVVNVYATIYPDKKIVNKTRCSGSVFDETHIVTSAKCIFDYNEERKKSAVKPENNDKNNTKYRMKLDIGVTDQVNHPHIVLSEKHIKSVKLHPNYNPKNGKADYALIELTREVNKFIKANQRIVMTPFLEQGLIEHFDGEILMFVGVDRKDNSTVLDSLGSALYRIDNAVCKNQNDLICVTNEFIAPWRQPQMINIGGTFYGCDKDNKWKQYALLNKQQGYISKALWIPSYFDWTVKEAA